MSSWTVGNLSTTGILAPTGVGIAEDGLVPKSIFLGVMLAEPDAVVMVAEDLEEIDDGV